jgi:hypothetical protein
LSRPGFKGREGRGCPLIPNRKKMWNDPRRRCFLKALPFLPLPSDISTHATKPGMPSVIAGITNERLRCNLSAETWHR